MQIQTVTASHCTSTSTALFKGLVLPVLARRRSKKELEHTARTVEIAANTQGTDFLTAGGAEGRRAGQPRSSTCEHSPEETPVRLLAAARVSWQLSEQWERPISK